MGEEIFALNSINLLILFGTRRNCLKKGRCRSSSLTIIRIIKLYITIKEAEKNISSWKG
jgi:hypothetical protein